jgi:hypothetical protein
MGRSKARAYPIGSLTLKTVAYPTVCAVASPPGRRVALHVPQRRPAACSALHRRERTVTRGGSPSPAAPRSWTPAPRSRARAASWG